MRTVDLEAWRGRRDAQALDPQAMVFRAQAASGKDGCRGCAFEGQWTTVCKAAAARAVQNGLPDCDDGFVYTLGDARQMDLIEERETQV